MSKAPATASSLVIDLGELDEKYLMSFATAYSDYRKGKQTARQILTPGLEPVYFDSRFGKKDFPQTDNFTKIKRTHPLLEQELTFYSDIVAAQETAQDQYDTDLLYNFFGYLGAMYLNYDSSSIELAVPTDTFGTNFTEYCWRKLAIAVFFEQERACWHGVALLKEVEGQTQLYQSDHEHWSVDELRDAYKDQFENFISILTSHIASRTNLFDTVCEAVCGRKFYRKLFHEFATNHIEKNKEPFTGVDEQFPAVVIYYNSGDQKRIAIDAPDPILRLNRTVYRPNSKQLVEDCQSLLGGDATAVAKLNISDWIRPYKKFVFAQLGLGFMARTNEHHRITVEFNDFLIKYVAYRSEKLRPPNMDKLQQKIGEFIKMKMDAPDLVPVMLKDGSLTAKPSDKFHAHFNAEADLRLEEHIQEIKSLGSSLLGKKSSSRDLMIISIEHPETKRGDVTVVVPLIHKMVAQGIEVEVCIGAFRYAEGNYAGKAIEEVSFACYIESIKQRQFVEDLANFFHQEYYLLIGANKKATFVNLKSGKRELIGIWQETAKKSSSNLAPNQGHTIIDGVYFEATSVDTKCFLIQTNNYANVVTRHGEFQLSERQARVIRFLHEQLLKKITEVKNNDILLGSGITGEALSRVFENQVNGVTVSNKAWGALIGRANHGFYRLIL